MERSRIEHDGRRIDKTGITVRQPPLRLLYPSPRMARKRPITDVDECYTFAAFAYHHPMALALWASLERAWPNKSGQPPNHYLESFTAQAVEQGVSTADLAEVECVEEESVRRRVRRGFAGMASPSEWSQIDKPAVVVVTGPEATELVSGPTAAEPDDPAAGDAAWNQSLFPDWSSDERNYRDIQRVILAAKKRSEEHR